MSGPISRKAVVEAVQEVKQAIETWERLPLSELPTVLWRGVPHKAISQDIQDASVRLFDLANTLHVEQIAKPLILAIDRFDDVFTKWGEDCSRATDLTDPSGSPEVWGAWQVVVQELTLRTWRHPEPIQSLLDLKPPQSRDKIARAYGFVDESGRPLIEWVQEELTKPGTHYDPKTWQHPSAKKYWAGIESQWRQREERLSGRVVERSKGREAAPRVKAEAPETVEQLLRLPGMTAEQAAKMKRISVDEVRQIAAALNIPLKGSTQAAFYAADKTTDDDAEIQRRQEAMRIGSLNSYPELGDNQDARILAMAADNQKPGDISRALQSAFPGLSLQRVSHVIGKASREAATAK